MSYIPRYTNFVDGSGTIRLSAGTCTDAYVYYTVPGKPDLSTKVEYKDPHFNQWRTPYDHSESFRQIKKSGQIKFTNYDAGQRSVKYDVVGIPSYSFVLERSYCDMTSPRVYGLQTILRSSWTTWYTYDDVIHLPDRTKQSSSSIPDIPSERNALRSDVVKKNLQTFDLLTDVAEFKETASMILSAIKAVRHPLESFIEFERSMMKKGQFHKQDLTRELDPLKVKKAIESKWMEYRYGIMPLVYSIKDALDLLKKMGNVYKTDRANRSFSYTVGSPPTDSFEGVFSYTIEEVSVKISAVGKASYAPGAFERRFFDQIGANPFQTAWELIPYSFVIDWFANIGDWILAQTSALSDGAQQRVFCESIKETRVKRTFIAADYTMKSTRSFPDGVIMVGTGFVSASGLVYEERSETYSRSTFGPGDVHLQFDALLNIKRMLDAWVLGQRPIIAGLRSLKRKSP